MIDWPQVVANVVWILGAALALAVLSYASWQSNMQAKRLRDVWRQPVYQVLLRTAAALFCAGMGLTASGLLEAALWLILAGLSLASLITFWRAQRAHPSL